METFLKQIFINNWPRKLVAFFTAIIIWLFVNNSIIDTTTVPNVPIRIINLPSNMTVRGLLPNGILSKRINLTLSGTKDVINELEPGDIEVLLDASSAHESDWIVTISKKNLVSLNPSIDLLNHLTSVNHSELVIKLSRLVTAKIPVTIAPPVGDPPPGYIYLDFWPQKLTQTISGPEEEVQLLKVRGLQLTLDLADITKDDLDSIQSSPGNYYNDEIRYLIPSKWRMVSIPFHNHATEEINDPEAQSLRIYFLRKQTLPLDTEVPLTIFFPMQTSPTLNPSNCKIAMGKYVKEKYSIPLLTVPFYVKDVSKLFLSIVRDNLQIAFVAAPSKEREFLQWSLEVINKNELEDAYLAYLITNLTGGKGGANALPKKREALIRKRFREYLLKLKLYTSETEELNLESSLEENEIVIKSY